MTTLATVELDEDEVNEQEATAARERLEQAWAALFLASIRTRLELGETRSAARIHLRVGGAEVTITPIEAEAFAYRLLDHVTDAGY